MKKTILFFGIIMFAFISINAQTTINNTEPTNGKFDFLGNWDLVMLALPQGDVRCQLLLNEKDGKLAGTLKFGELQPGEVAIVNPVIKDSVLTFNATLQNYDVDYHLSQNKDGQLNGTMYNNMFVVNGKRSEAIDSVKTK